MDVLGNFKVYIEYKHRKCTVYEIEEYKATHPHGAVLLDATLLFDVHAGGRKGEAEEQGVSDRRTRCQRLLVM